MSLSVITLKDKINSLSNLSFDCGAEFSEIPELANDIDKTIEYYESKISAIKETSEVFNDVARYAQKMQANVDLALAAANRLDDIIRNNNLNINAIKKLCEEARD